jgi:hypothetical protein
MWRSGVPPLRIVVDLAVGFTAMAVSFAVWEANPGNLIGPLLVAGKICFLCSAVRYISSPFWISVSWVAQLVASAVFAHLVLAYPSGRLSGRLDPSFVIAAYVYSVAFPVIELTVAPAGQLFGKCLTGPCPATPPLITDDPAFVRAPAGCRRWHQCGAGRRFPDLGRSAPGMRHIAAAAVRSRSR